MKCLFSDAELRELSGQSPYSFTELQQAAFLLAHDNPQLTLGEFAEFVRECGSGGLALYSTALLRSCP